MEERTVDAERAGQAMSGCRCLYRGGFTMVELVMVLGVLMILLSLILPGLASSYAAAKLSRASVNIKQNAVLVTLYTSDHDGVFPLADSRLYWSSARWYDPILNGDYAASPMDIDPDPIPEHNEITFAFSMCLVYDPALMRPGQTVPLDEARARPVRQSQVLFPSQKGMLWQWWIRYGQYETFWCCTQYRPVGPIAMCDTSVATGRWLDFLPAGQSPVENSIGNPVVSTWNGYLGIDRK